MQPQAVGGRPQRPNIVLRLPRTAAEGRTHSARAIGGTGGSEFWRFGRHLSAEPPRYRLLVFRRLTRCLDTGPIASRATAANVNREHHVPDLVVIGYPDEATAEKAYEGVGQLQHDLVMQVAGAAVVVKDADGKAKMVTKTGATSWGALMGGFIGIFIGLLFLIPWVG